MYLTGRERKVERRNDHQQKTGGPPSTCATPGGRARGGASSDTVKGHFLTNSGVTCTIKRAWTPPTRGRVNNTRQQLF